MTPARQQFESLRAQKPPVPLSAIASKIGVSKAAVVAYANGNYAASVEHIEAKILAAYTTRIDCPHLQTDIARTECAAFHLRKMPTSNPAALRHWQACQRCAFNPRATP
jgi:hypothetical protein